MSEGSFERYLKGEPINEQMAALARGEEEPESQPQATEQRRDTRQLDDDDREHLHRLTLEPGWNVLLRVIDRDLQTQEDQTRALSMEDPLGNRDAVTNGWAYMAMMRRFRSRITSLVSVEVKLLESRGR